VQWRESGHERVELPFSCLVPEYVCADERPEDRRPHGSADSSVGLVVWPTSLPCAAGDNFGSTRAVTGVRPAQVALVAAQAVIAPAQAQGVGLVAGVDGIRFVVPVRRIEVSASLPKTGIRGIIPVLEEASAGDQSGPQVDITYGRSLRTENR
jgi:hypothetical protein